MIGKNADDIADGPLERKIVGKFIGDSMKLQYFARQLANVV